MFVQFTNRNKIQSPACLTINNIEGTLTSLAHAKKPALWHM